MLCSRIVGEKPSGTSTLSSPSTIVTGRISSIVVPLIVGFTVDPLERHPASEHDEATAVRDVFLHQSKAIWGRFAQFEGVRVQQKSVASNVTQDDYIELFQLVS